MSDYDNAIFRLATAQEAEPEDYTGEDGLLYCGSCRQPKEAYFPEGKTLFGRDCQRHLKMQFFAEMKCHFSPGSMRVYTALITVPLVGLKPVKS